MNRRKRIFDVILALVLLLPLVLLGSCVAMVILIMDGRPIFHAAERMKSPRNSFVLWKFRTMADVPVDSGVSGGDKSARVTRIGSVLRRYRLDEIPQLLNVLRGEMSFVGPRPPLRRYVEMFPALYGEVLRARPGITGLATLLFHMREEALLAPCRTALQTEQTYIRQCIPVKARLDLIYLRRQSLRLDMFLLVATIFSSARQRCKISAPRTPQYAGRRRQFP